LAPQVGLELATRWLTVSKMLWLFSPRPKINSNSHSTPITHVQGFRKALLSCHSCLVINYIAIGRRAHNPKVGGSNPSPATIQALSFPASKIDRPGHVPFSRRLEVVVLWFVRFFPRGPRVADVFLSFTKRSEPRHSISGFSRRTRRLLLGMLSGLCCRRPCALLPALPTALTPATRP
jgi:hypothetical protein